MFKSARWRLVAWNAVVFGVLLAILSFAAYEVFNSRIYSGVDDDLNRQQSRVFQLLSSPTADDYNLYAVLSRSGFPGEYNALYSDPTGQIFQTTACPNPINGVGESIQDPACRNMRAISDDAITAVLNQAKSRHDSLVPGQHVPAALLFYTAQDLRTVTYEDQPWRVLTFSVRAGAQLEGVFQVARVVSGEASALQELRVLFIFGGVLGLLLALFASVFLADRALVPIRGAFARQRQFTADASHELRTPLALIRANAEMLYRHADSLDSDNSELVGEIIRETDHLNRLVGDLLTLARADAESLKLVSKPVDFRSLVESVHEDLRAIAESRGIDTELSLNGAVTVQGDEGRLRQLVLILLDNALKYTDAGGRVDVTVEREDNRARLVVNDTGIGIPAGDLPHIFERFYRVDRAREHESGGTGLGLAIAKWIVQAHHGNIKVESVAGRGARFQVDLPVG